jgi:hypothetical protein
MKERGRTVIRIAPLVIIALCWGYTWRLSMERESPVRHANCSSGCICTAEVEKSICRCNTEPSPVLGRSHQIQGYDTIIV